MAFDCVANYQRNVLATDVEGTRQCDYQECNYQCDGVPVDESEAVWKYPIKPSEVDHSTYNLFFAGPEITEIREAILSSLRKTYKTHISEIILGLSLPPEKEDLVYEAISGLVNARTTVTNSLGIPCYVKESANYVFLDSSISQVSNFHESIYTSQIYVTHRRSLGSMVDEFTSSSSRVSEKLRLFCTTNDRKVREGVLKSLSPEVLAMVYEGLWGRSFPGLKAKEAVAALETFLKADTFHVPTENVSFHVILSRKDDKTSYGAGSGKIDPEGKMRVYDASIARWVTPPLTEQERLAKVVQNVRSETMESLIARSPYGIAGSVLAEDGLFRIHIPRAEGSKKRTGKVATSWDVRLLQDFVVRVWSPDLPVSAAEKRPIEDLLFTLGRMKVEVPSDASYDYVRGLMNVYSINRKVPLSNLIQTKLEAEGLVHRD
jgi:hypothetical protein